MYYYVFSRDNRHFTIRKSATLDGIRKMAYNELIKWKGYGSPEVNIFRYDGTDIAMTPNAETFNPKTKRLVMGRYIGDAYSDPYPLFWNIGKKYVYDLLPNGSLGRINRDITLN